MVHNKLHVLRCGVAALALAGFAASAARADQGQPAEGAAAGTQPAAAPEAAAAEAVDPIVVTGSRIPRPNLTSNSPVEVVTGETFREQGAVNVEEVINQLPQVLPGLNATTNNGGNGTATVDIRGLGPARTLVLVNGRRFVPATSVGVVDLNTVPVQLIERVEVVTGGASATYGSDALAGVVNFVLRRNFEGLQLDSQYSITDEGDGETFLLSGALGINSADGRGNLTVAASYFDRNPIFQSQREFFAVDLTSNGSATGPAGRFDNSPFNPFASGGNRAFDQNGDPRAFVNQLPELNGGVGDRYNFAPVNYLQTPQKRVIMNLLGRYEVADGVEAFLEGSYIDSRVSLQLAETPATGILVDPNSPVLTPTARALLAGRPDPSAPAIFRRRLVEVGPRVQSYDNDVYQITAGIRGTVFDDLRYELYYGYGRTEVASGLTNDVSRARLTAGLNGCPVGSPAGCVPVNAFGAGRITPEAANYIRIGSSVDQFEFQRHNVVGSISGDLFELPAGPAGFALGAEYREDSSSFVPSEAKRQGDLTGFNAQAPISGGFDVKEVFGELRLPILADMPGFQYLGLEGRARYSDYSSVGGVFTYSLGGEWTPVEGVRLRSLYARAVRAPSVFELFQAGDQNFLTATDPCARISATNEPVPAPSAAVAAICQLQGLPDPRTNPNIVQTNGQIEGRNVGNPGLKEETGDTLTAGVVLMPRFLPGFSLSVDYFSIKVKDYVARAYGGAQGLIDACFSSGVTTAGAYAADPACRLITRNASGELFVELPQSNSGKFKTTGIDAQLSYVTSLGLIGRPEDRLSVRGSLTHTSDYKLDGVEYAGRSTFDFATIPDWKANVRLGYSAGPVELSLNWRWVGPTRDEAQADDEGEELRIGDEHVFDLGARLKLGKTLELFAGVQNLFDNRPPLILNGVSNTDLFSYDGIGRTFFIGATTRF